jgi:PAS domain S-box-containing protein
VEAALAGQPADFEAEVPYRAGKRWIRASYTPHRDADGAVAGFVALVSDISASKQTEAALREARGDLEDRVRRRTAELSRASAMLRAVEQAVQAGVAAVDRDGRQVYVNPAFCRMLGWAADELLGALPPFVYWPPEERAAIERAFTLTRRGVAPPEGFELRFMRKDGERFLAQILLAPLSDGEGRPDGWVASLYDVTERKRVEESLRRSETQLAEAQRLAGVGSWEWSVDEDRVSWSGELHRIYGLLPGDFGGTLQSFLERVHPEDRGNTRSRIEEAYRTGLPFGFEERIVRPDGSVRTLFSQGKAIRDETGRVARMVGTCQDVTERKKAEEERVQLDREQAARAAAEKANRLKDEFLATLSHELRTPLNAIVGWSHMLLAGDLDQETTRRAIETISRNAMIQNQLISDILDIQRISSGKLRLNLQPADAGEAVEAAIETVRPAAAAKEIRLEALLEPDAGPVLADPDRLQQIVWNLLSNAVKFCPRGGQVEVRLARNDGVVEVTVGDDGPGIKPEFLPYIFERFRQGDASSTRGQGGLGLGLAIVRNLVDLHGGTVTAESDGLGRGARFIVTLPTHAGAETGTPIPRQ